MKRKLAVPAGIAVLVCLGFLTGRATVHLGGTASTSPRVLYYVDPMHPAYRSDKPGIAPDCGMALEPVFEGQDVPLSTPLAPGALSLTPQRQQLIGLQVTTVSRSGGTRTIRTTGKIVPEDNRLYRIQAGFEGWVDSLRDTLPGTSVHKDQVLATLYGPEVRTVALNYIAFVSGVERVKQGMGQGDTRSLDDSRRVNEEQLRLLGMGQKQIAELAESRHTTSSLDLVAPADAIVLARNVSPYQRFEKGAELYRLADLSKVWIIADLHGLDGMVKPGQTVRVSVPELNRSLNAHVSSAIPLFDDSSRSLKLRLEADNPGLLLRPDMFVDVEFETSMPPGLIIPSDAVVDSGARKIVYVESQDGVFEPRIVRTDGVYGDSTRIAEGLKEHERVVVAGNFLLDSESRMRSSQSTGSSAEAQPTPARQQNQSFAPAATQAAVRDPVCGMQLQADRSEFSATRSGKTYYFCSESCRRKFLAAELSQPTGVSANLAKGAQPGRPQ